MSNGIKTGGRKKGTPNKLTSSAKETISQCASLLETNGKTLFNWVDKNETNERIFWSQIYTKLLPLQVDANVDSNLTVEIVRFGKTGDKK